MGAASGLIHYPFWRYGTDMAAASIIDITHVLEAALCLSFGVGGKPEL